MYRFFVVVGLIAVCVIGAGFYFGYFHIGSDSSDGMMRVTFTIDQKGIQRDEKKVVEDVKELKHPAKE